MTITSSSWVHPSKSPPPEWRRSPPTTIYMTRRRRCKQQWTMNCNFECRSRQTAPANRVHPSSPDEWWSWLAGGFLFCVPFVCVCLSIRSFSSTSSNDLLLLIPCLVVCLKNANQLFAHTAVLFQHCLCVWLPHKIVFYYAHPHFERAANQLAVGIITAE